MIGKGLSLLKFSFLIGAVADAIVAVNWFLIAEGAEIPNLMCGLVGTGAEYRFAMYIAALFMTGWSVILAWGWFRPFERRGLLLITAVLLLVSIILELAFYRSLLSGPGFIPGLGVRIALIAKFTISYFYARPPPGTGLIAMNGHLILGEASSGLILLIGVFVLVGLVVAYFVWQQEKKRTEQFQELARQLGLSFHPRGDDSLQERLSRFNLFSRGRSRRILNMLHGENGEIELAIFDYRFTTGGGKNSNSHRQSVMYLCSPALDLPHFAVRPEGFFHKIGAALGYQDIDFDSHPEFSRSYLLQGEDEGAVRGLFDRELLTFFESQQNLCVEGGGRQLICYRQRKRIKPEQVHELMEEGLRVFAAFGGPVDA